MSVCLRCGQSKEYEKDRYCQRCEGLQAGEHFAANVRHEVLFKARERNISPQSGQMLRYKTNSMNRWRKIALEYVDIKQFNTFYQSFMITFTRLTSDIGGAL